MIDIHSKKCVTDSLSKMDPRDASASKYGWCDPAEGADDFWRKSSFAGCAPAISALSPYSRGLILYSGGGRMVRHSA